MTPSQAIQGNGQSLVFRDNSEWLRWGLLSGAIGMGVLVADNLIGTGHDIGKIIGGILGALLLAFGGSVLQVRRVEVNPVRRDIVITSRTLLSTTNESIRFDEVIKLLLVLTYERDENLLPANRQSERWSVVFVLKDRSLPVNLNPHVSKEQAMADAKRLQPLLDVEISNHVDDGIAHLARSGRTIDAVVVTRQQSQMTLTEAKDQVDRIAGH